MRKFSTPFTAAATAVSALLIAGAFTATAVAQPAPAYTGPSLEAAAHAAAKGTPANAGLLPLMSVKQLLDTAADDQPARLQGRIVQHLDDEHYSFEDATGRIRVEIDAEDFPVGQTVSAQQRVELVGEFDKGLRQHEFEVDRVTLLP